MLYKNQEFNIDKPYKKTQFLKLYIYIYNSKKCVTFILDII